MKWVILAAIFIFVTQLRHVKFSVKFGESLISQFKDFFIGWASRRKLPPGSRETDIEEPQLPPQPDVTHQRRNEPP